MQLDKVPVLKLLGPGWSRPDVIVWPLVSGIANAALLGVVNTAAVTGMAGTPATRYAFMFVVLFLFYAFCYRKCFQRVTELFEDGLASVRTRILDQLAWIDLYRLQSLDPSNVHQRLSQDTSVISESAGVIAAAFQAAVMVAFTSVYMAYLSGAAFLVAVVLVGGGLMIYVTRAHKIRSAIQRAAGREIVYFDRTSDVLNGFKELKLSRNRFRRLTAEIRTTIRHVRRLKVLTADMFDTNYIFAYSLFYMLMAVVVFILPQYVQSSGPQLLQLTATILFIIGPLSTVVAAIPALSKSNLAAERLLALEESIAPLDAVEDGGSAQPIVAGSFQNISLEDVVFRYQDRDGDHFSVGPISLTVHAGEILMIAGGNGSGKSTLLKILTGLYHPSRGNLVIDGVIVGPANRQAYRELFSAVFSDFYLFKKLYGIEVSDPAQVGSLLSTMGIEDKTALRDDTFTTLALSTGQRKRLALVVALLENRPILILDEWAADQDPQFRDYFYNQLIPELKRQGKTTIAVTHDERYFRVADRVVHMEYGKIDRLKVKKQR